MTFASRVIMIRPAAFGFNQETAASNGFQAARELGDAAALAVREFDAMVAALTAAGIDVTVWADEPAPPRPDAVFPNNWLSTHASGRVYLYPMATPSRRAEVRRELVEGLRARYAVAEIVDWTGYAAEGRALEGTGSLVLDGRQRRVFACRSSRTEDRLVRAWAEREGVVPVIFDACDAKGRAVYHTNVMLCIGDGFAACGLSLVAQSQRAAVREQLAGEFIELSAGQIDRFAGNMLQLVTREGAPLLVLSRTAHDALTPEQRRVIARHSELLPVEIPTIEALGGGSARCMLAELLLPPR